MNSNRLLHVRRTPAALALISAIMVAGCSLSNTQIDFLDKSATLRVDVEVYKGPLSKEPTVQFAELKGIVYDSMRAMDILERNMENGNTRMHLLYDLKKGKENYEDAWKAIRLLDPIIQKCWSDEKKSDKSDLILCRSLLGKVSTYGSYFKRRAAYWATAQVTMSPENKRLRNDVINFAQFAAEYGNQIVSRADALLKQAGGARGIAILREQLPNSVYLRDSAPTAYLNLYDWYKASNKVGKVSNWNENLDKGEIDIEDLVHIVEHVIADNYWSHINTVFTAGQGKVYTALVKDDIGNWNVKSFDNSPGDLLDAYKKLGLDAIKAAAKLASGGGDFSALSALSGVLNSVNQAALGSPTGSGNVAETEAQLAAMRIKTARLIMEIGRKKYTKEEQETAADQIQQLLELHRDLVSAMAETTAKAANPKN